MIRIVWRDSADKSDDEEIKGRALAEEAGQENPQCRTYTSGETSADNLERVADSKNTNRRKIRSEAAASEVQAVTVSRTRRTQPLNRRSVAF